LKSLRVIPILRRDYHLVKGAIIVFYDSRNAIDLSKNMIHHHKSKDINIGHFKKEARENGGRDQVL